MERLTLVDRPLTTDDSNGNCLVYVTEREHYDYDALVEQGERISDTLRVFVPEKLMSDRAIDVARLQRFIDIARNEEESAEARHDASFEVMNYLTSPDSPTDVNDVDYMMALWSDLPKIDVVASNYRTRLEECATDESRQALEKLDGKTELVPDDWHSIRVGVDVPKIVELSQEVNIEAILARSALLLDHVATATEYTNDLLGDIIEIETVYAPLLDLLGLHAWEAILKHHTERVRLFGAGLEDEYNEASAYIESVRSEGLADEVIANVMGITDDQEFDSVFLIDNEDTPYGSKSYYSAYRFTDENGFAKRFISRIKSPASWAHKKHYSYEGEAPQDTYAGTSVSENIEEMVRSFKTAYANIQDLSSCELVSAPSKEHPIHLRGKKGFVVAVMALLGDEFEGIVDIDDSVPDDVEEPFQVLKVTFNIQKKQKVLPVEIQFQPRKDRNRSRLGGASHLCFKGKNGNGLPGNVPGGSEDLRKVNNRKWATMGGGESIYHVPNPDAEERRARATLELQDTLLEVSSDERITF